MTRIRVIAHDIRSCHNVGSLLRTCDGMAVEHVYFTGYTPYPAHAGDVRLPYLAAKIDRQISKTSLGAEVSTAWSHEADLMELIGALRSENWTMAALEQHPAALQLPDYRPPERLCLLLGNEVSGVDPQLLAIFETILEIPMFGAKESLNVAQAAAMALYHLRFSGGVVNKATEN